MNIIGKIITNPFTAGRIYLIFDPTHNVKNVYNNFQLEKKISCPGLHPFLEEVTNPDFADIERVFEIENNKPLKIAHN